jgi:tRNA pseudouridine13 synthase
LDVPEIDRKLGMTVYATKTAGIGGVIRREVEDFVVEEILTDGARASVNPAEQPSRLGRHLFCVVVKRDWDTLLAIRALAHQLKVSPERISFAGIKDTRAVTAQHISLYGVRPEVISRVKIKNMRVYPVRYADEKVSVKLLFGNQFTIAVRSISLETDKVKEIVNGIREEISALGGVPNFFGHQRFGTVRPITHLVGKAIAKGDLEEAAFVFLACSSKYESTLVRAARERLGGTRDFVEALRGFPVHFKYERLMLEHLVSFPNDFLGAFRRLPLKLRELFVQAYQSFLFNLFLSERMRRGIMLNRVYVGDYVVVLDEHGLPARIGEEVTAETFPELDRMVEEGRACVAIPLVGFKQSLSGGAQGEIEQGILEKEGTKPEDFKLSAMPEISAPGGLRAVLTPLIDFVVDEPVEDALDPCKFALRLRFVLRKGCYATVPLREFMKPENPVEAGF